jgi:TRAP transporter 4TM/12TM fusion protein
VLVLALIAAAIHLYQTATYALPSGQFKNLHVGLSLIVVYLSLAEVAQKSAAKYLRIVLALLCLLPLVYIHLQFDALISDRMFEASTFDTIVSAILCLTTLTAVWLQWGATIPLIAGASLLYAYLGAYLPGELFFHSGIELGRLLSYASIPFFQGILGSLTSMSASIVFIFMLFAGLLKATGGIELIMTAARAMGGRTRGGPAQIAVFSSGFMGMISGSTVANVASTGAMTIPMMKRFGFRAEHAAAIEAVASTGGQFAPPVMGLTAFLIVGMTGIPYNKIMLAATLPALVYYGYLVAAVNLQARADESRMAAAVTPALPGAPDLTLRDALRQYGHLFIAVVVLVWLLAVQMPPAFAAAWAMAIIALTETAKQLWIAGRKPLRGLAAAVRVLARGLDDGVRTGAQLAIVIAAIGIFVDVLVTTGFAQKLSYLILDLASGQLWLILLMTAVACLVFGLGMPTPAAYILVALLGVPALERVGVPLLAAHMFVFYFANMSAITPPVAVAALVAAKLAGASYFRTAFAACRLGLAGFVLPFVFVYAPAILLLEGGAVRQWATFLAALLGLVAINAALIGHGVSRLSIPLRSAVAFAAALLLQFELSVSVAGAAIVLAIFGLQYFRNVEPQRSA